MNGPEERDQREETREQMEFDSSDPGMQEFERTLARAMRRVEVRSETTAKLLALADEAERGQVPAGGMRLMKFSNGGRVIAMPRIPQMKAWMGGAIAAVLAMGCFVGAHLHTEHERRVQAQRQFETAERITDQALERTRQQLRAQGIYLDQ